MINSHKVTKHACTSSWSPLAHSIHHTYHQVTVMNKKKKKKGYKQLIYIYIHISCKCDTNCAGHFTLDAHASRPVACPWLDMWSLTHVGINSLGPSDAIWWQRSGSTLAWVMACCLTAPSHYLNQCWLVISTVQWHSSKGKFTRTILDISQWNYQEN